MRSRGVLVCVLTAMIFLVSACPPADPGPVPTPQRAVSVGIGNRHICAALTNGTVKCWGSNQHGQLGNGTTTPFETANPIPGLVSGVSGATNVSSGSDFTCVVANGVRCWGQNADGQLGDGTTTERTTPVAVSNVAGAVDLAAGAYHTCALIQGGTVKCWGQNDFGQLGNGSNADSLTPVSVAGITEAVQISAGTYATCVLNGDGTAQCWGGNFGGVLGNGTTTNSNVPTTVVNLSQLSSSSITVGDGHACASEAEAELCWGTNYAGQLGNVNGDFNPHPVPASVPSLSGGMKLAAGGLHTCGTRVGEAITCWGFNGEGQLGNGAFSTAQGPVETVQISDVDLLVAGGDNTCAVTQDGALRCWGGNDVGQVGDGTTANRNVPTLVAGLT